MKNNISRLLLSVVVAFCLWFYVITVVSPGSEETFHNIPVVFQGEVLLEDRGLIVTDGKEATITLELSGNRTDLNKLDSTSITVIADMSKIYEAGEHRIGYDILYPGTIASDAFQELSKTPSRITLTVEQLVTKEIPVNVTYTGTVPSNCIADTQNAELDYETVLVEGPASVISQIAQARFTVDITDRSESFNESYRYTLCDAEGNAVDASMVRTNVAEVSLTLLIQHVKEVPLVVNVIDGGGATVQTTDIVLSTPTIKIAGSAAALELIDQIEVGKVDLAQYMRDTEITFPLTIPANVTNLTGVTTVTVSVKFPDLRILTLKVTEFEAQNVPEGLVAEIVTQELSIRVRGPRELVEALTAEDIRILVDLTDRELGTFTVKAEVVMGAEFAQVGIIGTYNVSVSLTEPLEVASLDPDSTGV